MSKEFTPFSDSNTFYVLGNSPVPLADIIDQAKSHFGERFDLIKIRISAEHLHTRCIGYDLYDPADYDEYIVVELE